MRKLFVIAMREYGASVRTKAFLIGLLIMPVMMVGSIAVQALLKDFRDTRAKKVAVVDRTPNAQLTVPLQTIVNEYNEHAIFDPKTGQQTKPALELEVVPVKENTPEAIDELRAELSQRIRDGKLLGFLEIGPDVLELPPEQAEKISKTDDSRALRYQTNQPVQRDFSVLAKAGLNRVIHATRAKNANVDYQLAHRIVEEVPLVSKGLSKRDANTGKVVDASEQGRLAPLIVPFVMMMLMFMITMMGATPLMQSVLEEKMQRIAEVLLGSVRPFTLMMGKLLGMTCVSLTISVVYLAGAFWAAQRFDFAEHIQLSLILWFLLFQMLTTLMFGSLFIAIGAACTDFKETQNLMWPVMLLACIPLFVLGKVVEEPNGTVVTALSFFPFATPMLMLARLGIPPGLPLWQPVVGVVSVLMTTLFCVYAAGRIFRIGILMQGKGAKMSDLFRWVFRG